jgi:hypothetical protein
MVQERVELRADEASQPCALDRHPTQRRRNIRRERRRIEQRLRHELNLLPIQTGPLPAAAQAGIVCCRSSNSASIVAWAVDNRSLDSERKTTTARRAIRC